MRVTEKQVVPDVQSLTMNHNFNLELIGEVLD
jgi:hypothetical protein